MKLWYEKVDRGYNVFLSIDGNIYKSLWSAPPKEIDKVGIDYLSKRYDVITTNERLIEFKKLWKKLWLVSDKQLNEMRRAVGLNYSKKPYKNRFFCEKDNEAWNDLVNKGLAIKKIDLYSDNSCYFFLTKDGIELVYGNEISDSIYSRL
ncbi:hypothetical protein [Clostridium hydrogeniformans]|uniref:hypothetical protein n=1 Tax=Clostridium hydrogeniformans TaxID=349933 RepID=UPI000484103F|nr:hypothetical protein [Clostridium hydrogeniformans]